MVKRSLGIVTIISVGLFCGGLPGPGPAQVEARVRGGHLTAGTPQERSRQPLVLATAAIKGTGEKKTAPYTYSPQKKTKPQQSTKGDNKEKSGGQTHPKPDKPNDRER